MSQSIQIGDTLGLGGDRRLLCTAAGLEPQEFIANKGWITTKAAMPITEKVTSDWFARKARAAAQPSTRTSSTL